MCIMVVYYQKSKSCYSLAMTNCLKLKPVQLNLMEFHWNLMEWYNLLTFIAMPLLSPTAHLLIKAYLAPSFSGCQDPNLSSYYKQNNFSKSYLQPDNCTVPHNLLITKDVLCKNFTECSNKNRKIVKDPMQILFERKYINLLEHFFFL